VGRRHVPLGYATKDGKIVVVEEEAERVRTIFRRYLELGSLDRLMTDLREQGVVTKLRLLKTGCTVGGIPFTRGPLAHFLRNRFYIGEVVFKGEVLPGEQPAILDRELFDAVQTKLNEQRNNHSVARDKSKSLLIGRIYDDRGNRMSPSHVRKGGIKYRYYLSSPLALAPLRLRMLAVDPFPLAALRLRLARSVLPLEPLPLAPRFAGPIFPAISTNNYHSVIKYSPFALVRALLSLEALPFGPQMFRASLRLRSLGSRLFGSPIGRAAVGLQSFGSRLFGSSLLLASVIVLGHDGPQSSDLVRSEFLNVV
jgi:Recombinase